MAAERLTKGLTQHRRRMFREEGSLTTIKCPECDFALQPDIALFKAHVRDNAAKHPNLVKDQDIEQAFSNTLGKISSGTRKRPISGDTNTTPVNRRNLQTLASNTSKARSPPERRGHASPDQSGRHARKARSPSSSVDRHHLKSPSSAGRDRDKSRDTPDDYDRGPGHHNPSGRSIWNYNDPPTADRQRALHDSRSSQPAARVQGRPTQNKGGQIPTLSHLSSQHAQLQPSETEGNEEEGEFKILKQPKTKPIAADKLIPEVKNIYEGLVMVETKCIEVDAAQAKNPDEHQLSNEQWSALVSLHRTLLHEHHDFFLASQHPSGSGALHRLASKYAMPARMWRHAIHSFLELLRRKLPHSFDHMVTFIYVAYGMVGLLYETVPAFEETWIECLGDLGRYRMAIEDEDINDREIWTRVSQRWYTLVSDKTPMTGRLYHHLAILARPNAVQQLYFYTKSLCVEIPFASTRESIMTLFDPLLNNPTTDRLEMIDSAFVRVHGIMFSGKHRDQLDASIGEFHGDLDAHIARTGKTWLESGPCVGIALSCALLSYGSLSNPLMKIIAPPRTEDDEDVPMDDEKAVHEEPADTFDIALSFAMRTYEIVLCRWGDMNTLPCLHVTLVFIYYMSKYHDAMALLEDKLPWKLFATMLNLLLDNNEFSTRFESAKFPDSGTGGQAASPLSEDYALRGLLYAEDYFPSEFFKDAPRDLEERYFQAPSQLNPRQERLLWIGVRIAAQERWLLWNKQARKFSVPPKYDIEIEHVATGRTLAALSPRTPGLSTAMDVGQ